MDDLMKKNNFKKFKNLTYKDFRRLAKDDTLSKSEKIGFPDSYRKDQEKQIFLDINSKLNNLSKKKSDRF